MYHVTLNIKKKLNSLSTLYLVFSKTYMAYIEAYIEKSG